MTTLAARTPYKGLTPYMEEDAEFFFGREHEQNIITANLISERLTLLYGASGVGKSSVLRAGVGHHLKQLAKQNIERLGNPKYVITVFNEWRESDPMRSLLARVKEAVERTLSGTEIEPVEPLLSFTATLDEWTKRARGQLLIILDQFEEYFLYHQNEDGEGTFAEEFPRAVNNTSLAANFLISFRDDAMSKMDFFKVRVPKLYDNYLRIEHLNRHSARAAIEEPIRLYNDMYAKNGDRFSIEPELVETVLKQVETGQVTLGEAGRGGIVAGTDEKAETQIETPYLQLVMTRLWNEENRVNSHQLRLKTLTDLKGAENIVRTHLDDVMGALNEEEREIAARIFHYLVTPSGTKIAYSSFDLARSAELVEEEAELVEEELTSVLEKLSQGALRILRPVGARRERNVRPRYEIFHDVLAPAILNWRTRQGLAKVQAEAARKAEAQAKEAEAQAREEEKAESAKRLRWAAGILAIMFVIAVVAFGWALDRQSVAKAEAQKAASAKTDAENHKEEAEEKSRQLEAQTEELKTARQAAESDKQTAVDESKRANRERSRAVKNLSTAINALQGDLEAADDSFGSALAERTDQCDLRGALRDTLRAYDILYRRYEALGAETQKATVRKRMGSVNDKLKGLAGLTCP